MKARVCFGWAMFAMLILLPAIAPARADQAGTPQASSAPPAGERLNVENLKQRYWAKGKEEELRVVQNRLYSKAGRFELGAFGGVISTDPFLAVKDIGLDVGYYFTEYFGLGLIAWKSYAWNSSAYTTFQQQQNTLVDVNRPRSFMGIDAKASLLYGKLSLLGQAIIYYDLAVMGGGGEDLTESGNYVAPFAGIQQQIYLSKHASLQVSFIELVHSEKVQKGTNPAVTSLTRTQWENNFTLGLNFLL